MKIDDNIEIFNESTFFSSLKRKKLNPLFLCVISHTETSQTEGLTVAGANTELIQYTPAADTEFLYYGKCKCIDGIPATPDGKPTPALITKAALDISNLPFLVIDAGVKIKPSIPYISFNLQPGKNISSENAMKIEEVNKAFNYGQLLGQQLAKTNNLVIIGESIPGGTTTAMSVLSLMKINITHKMSSSLFNNPHKLKQDILQKVHLRLGRTKIKNIFEAIAIAGDPMIPSIAGLASGIIKNNSNVILAGGTQMCAVLKTIKETNNKDLSHNLAISTTPYVAYDKSADFFNLVNSIIPNTTIIIPKLRLERSSKPGIQAYAKGFVKEGVGAGGVSATVLLSKKNIGWKKLLKKIDLDYNLLIEKYLV